MPGETISVAIGQGAVTVTPIQLARMIGAVASGGDLPQPHLLKNLNAKTGSFPLADDTVEQVTQGMWGSINEGGTGSSLETSEYRLLRQVRHCSSRELRRGKQAGQER